MNTKYTVELKPIIAFEIIANGVSIGEFNKVDQWEGMLKLKSVNKGRMYQIVDAIVKPTKDLDGETLFDALLQGRVNSHLAMEEDPIEATVITASPDLVAKIATALNVKEGQEG